MSNYYRIATEPSEEVNVYIDPKRWAGESLPLSIRQELVNKYNQDNHHQTIVTEPPFVIIKTYPLIKTDPLE